MNTSELIIKAEEHLRGQFAYYENIAYFNQEKVLKSLQGHHVRESHFSSSSGYGYGDIGRDDLESIYAEIFGAEDALVRSQIVSGTHAISACLSGILRAGDELISITGSPYDTLKRVIGFNTPGKGTLVDRGIIYSEVALQSGGTPDYLNIPEYISSKTRMVLIQRSKGYSLRKSLGIMEIEELVKIIRTANPHTIIFVDNCYGEFTDRLEPTQVGADLIAGSLIKNPGGGLAPAGGYVAGHKDLVEEVSYQITAPGLGKELGASLVNNRLLYQGLFMAPHVVLQSLKGALLLAYLFSELGYQVFPTLEQPRGDIVQAIKMGSVEEVIDFCQIVQNNSPVDSDVQLEYGSMPGYSDKVIMAAGTFIQGSSIELSCDAPLREPYSVFFQGGLTYEHVRFVIKQLLEHFIRKR